MLKSPKSEQSSTNQPVSYTFTTFWLFYLRSIFLQKNMTLQPCLWSGSKCSGWKVKKCVFAVCLLGRKPGVPAGTVPVYAENRVRTASVIQKQWISLPWKCLLKNEHRGTFVEIAKYVVGVFLKTLLRGMETIRNIYEEVCEISAKTTDYQPSVRLFPILHNKLA